MSSRSIPPFLCLVVALVVITAHATAASIAETLSQQGFVPLATRLRAVPPQVSLGGATRDVFLRPADGPAFTLPVNNEGMVTLPPNALPKPSPGALGWRVSSQFIADDPDAKKRVAYAAIMTAQIGEARLLVPHGQKTETAKVQSREALPANYDFTFNVGVLPTGARLSLNFSVLDDWRLPADAGAVFSVAAFVPGEAPAQLYQNDADVGSQNAGPPWNSADLDLGPFAGKDVTLLFRTRDLPGAPAPNLAFPVWGDVTLYTTTRPAQHAGPGILLISLDTLRADRLGCYGYPRPTSPNIDAFAAEGALFELALSPAPMTTPAHASMFLGLSPYVHRAGIYTEGFRLQRHWPMLAELLATHGYRTHAQTEGVAVAGHWGFSPGFQTYSDGPSPLSHVRMIVPETFAAASDWLGRFGHLPYFLFLHTYQLHDPYDSPAEYTKQFVDPAYTGKPMNQPGNAKTPAERADASNRYDAGIAYTDAMLGEFFARLRAQGRFEDSWIIITSDHGEELWEHGNWGHARTLYHESIHVPLIVRPPGGLSKARRVSTPVLTTDLFATILAAANVALPPGRDSVSLLPLVTAEANSYPRTEVDGFYRGYEEPKRPGDPPNEWEVNNLRTQEHTYIATTPAPPFGPEARPLEGLFSNTSDPAQREDLAAGNPEATTKARETLRALREKESGMQKAEPPAGDPAHELDREALKGLGYF